MAKESHNQNKQEAEEDSAARLSGASGNEYDSPAAQNAYRQLIEMLLAGKFPAGAPVREAVLAKELGLSRNAVREALNQLVGLDILEYTPYCGYRLLPYTTRDMLEWSYLRLAIEPVALKQFFDISWKERVFALAEMESILDREEQCIEKGDVEGMARSDFSFHLKIVEASGNRRMSSCYLRSALPFLANINPKGGRGLMINPESKYVSTNLLVKEEQIVTGIAHRNLLKEMKSGSPAKCVEMLREHLQCNINSCQSYLVSIALEQCPQGNLRNADAISGMVKQLMNFDS